MLDLRRTTAGLGSFGDGSSSKDTGLCEINLVLEGSLGGFLSFSGGRGMCVGPEIVNLGPLPGPTRPRCGLGKAPAGPRLICTDFQPGRPSLRPFREVF